MEFLRSRGPTTVSLTFHTNGGAPDRRREWPRALARLFQSSREL